MDLQLVINRLMRLARTDFTAFNEIKTDPTATTSGVVIVAIATLLTGLGSWLWVKFNLDYADVVDLGDSDVLLKSVIIGGILQVLLWLAWVAIAYFMLTQVFKIQALMPELMRTMGYAFAPMALSIFFFIPILDMPIGILALAATAVMSTVAISACANGRPGQIILANLAGFGVFLLVLSILGNDSNNLAPGIFLVDIDALR
ncbi:MAG TPA: YIP1 family protein [Dehalococcoidia bacterium]|nr:YIP1 family protein [Dehalococcoidia bacterium]